LCNDHAPVVHSSSSAEVLALASFSPAVSRGLLLYGRWFCFYMLRLLCSSAYLGRIVHAAFHWGSCTSLSHGVPEWITCLAYDWLYALGSITFSAHRMVVIKALELYFISSTGLSSQMCLCAFCGIPFFFRLWVCVSQKLVGCLKLRFFESHYF